jgi:hypothetical protein
MGLDVTKNKGAPIERPSARRVGQGSPLLESDERVDGGKRAFAYP